MQGGRLKMPGGGVPARITLPGLLWCGVVAILLWVIADYARYAIAVLHVPSGLNYSEGLIWQQALWLFGPHGYGDIQHGPFLVFEYPPVFLLALRAAAALGIDTLVAGRSISLASTILAACLLGWLVRGLAPGRRGWLAAGVAAMLPFTLLPVISWSPLLRVDMLALALTYAGIVLAVASLRRPALLHAAMLAFVLAAYTKQTFLAAPCAVLLTYAARDWRQAARAAAGGLAEGLAILGVLSWLTQGGFLRHILLYNINRFSLAIAVRQAGIWLLAYPLFVVLTCAAIWISWRAMPARQGGRWRDYVRGDDRSWTLCFLTVYLALSTGTLAFAGKSGASINYFIEWQCLWCVWIGVLCGAMLNAADGPRVWALTIPALLIAQTAAIPAAIRDLQAGQISAARALEAQALLTRVRAIPGPLLSDDMVLTLRAGRDVLLEPAILAELSVRGQWHEQALIDMLAAHRFGAVVTAYDPGDPTFDARYLPATRAAILANYPMVTRYGDYRLRLPAEAPAAATR